MQIVTSTASLPVLHGTLTVNSKLTDQCRMWVIYLSWCYSASYFLCSPATQPRHNKNNDDDGSNGGVDAGRRRHQPSHVAPTTRRCGGKMFSNLSSMMSNQRLSKSRPKWGRTFGNCSFVGRGAKLSLSTSSSAAAKCSTNARLLS